MVGAGFYFKGSSLHLLKAELHKQIALRLVQITRVNPKHSLGRIIN